MNHKRHAWAIPAGLIWGAAALFYIVEWMQRVMPTLLVEPISHSMGITTAVLGAVFSVYYYAYAISQVPAGLFIDYFGPRKMLTIAACLVALGITCFAMAISLPLLYLGRILIGVGSAFAFTGCIKITRIWFKKRWFPLMVSLTNSVGMLGALFGAIPLAYMVTHVGWRLSLWSGVIVTVFVAILLVVFVRDRCGQHHFTTLIEGSNAIKALWSGLMTVAKVPQIWLIGLYAGLMQVPIIAYAELWAVPFLHHADHLTTQAASDVNSFVFTGIFIGGPVFGFFFKNAKWTQVALLIGNIGVLVVLHFLFFYHAESEKVLSGLSFLLGFFTVSMLISYTWATQLFGENHTAAAVSFTNMIGVIIGGIFQPLIGILFPQSQMISQYHEAFGLLIGCSIASLLLMLFLSQIFKRKQAVII